MTTAQQTVHQLQGLRTEPLSSYPRATPAEPAGPAACHAHPSYRPTPATSSPVLG